MPSLSVRSMTMFSKCAEGLRGTVNRLYLERDALLRRGKPVTDLIGGPVYPHDIYPPGLVSEALRYGAEQARVYRPDPLGQRVAREAIRDDYEAVGLSIPPDQIVLTPGTSLSYWYAFKLFADVGDEILCPCPTYPLFETIAALAGVRIVSYPLDASRQWAMDLADLEARITVKSRAIILISPHNPTGAVASADEVAALAALARRYRLPIISDEVFSPFLFTSSSFPRPAATSAPLVVTLNGLSKGWALPGMKIGWMALSGETALVRSALEALSVLSDTFLPVNEVAQFALREIMRQGRPFLAAYQRTVKDCAELAVRLLSQSPRLRLVPPAGGFYLSACVVSPTLDDEALALDLLRQHHILVHPGFFYDLPPSHFVFRFASEPTALAEALSTLIHHLCGTRTIPPNFSED